MNPIVLVMWRPLTTKMLVVAPGPGGLPALEKMCVDIFPCLIHVE